MATSTLCQAKKVPHKNSTVKAKKNKTHVTNDTKSPKHLAIDELVLPASRQTNINEHEFMREKIFGEDDHTQIKISSNHIPATIDACEDESDTSNEGDSDICNGGEEISITKVPSVDLIATKTENVLATPIVSEFKPPLGFRRQNLKENSIASRLFNESNLKGKQIWHITVPSPLDIKIFKELSSTADLNGTNVISINGDKYEFLKSQIDSQHLKILAPVDKKEGYSFVPKSISQKLCLTQITPKPSISGNESKLLNGKIMEPISKLSRPQPKGLKMRFHHVGFDRVKTRSTSDEPSSSGAGGEKVTTILNFKSFSKNTGHDGNSIQEYVHKPSEHNLEKKRKKLPSSILFPPTTNKAQNNSLKRKSDFSSSFEEPSGMHPEIRRKTKMSESAPSI